MKGCPARIIVPLLAALSALLLEPITKRATAQAAPSQATLVVASVNVREGARLVRRVDDRNGDDRRVLARRVVNRGARVPDVVLLQEAMGTAGAVARALNTQPRAQRFRARYAVAVPTSNRLARTDCNGSRGPHRVIRDGAILVNTRTVGRVLDRGFVRSRGRWHAVRGYDTVACAEQAWAMVQMRSGAPGHRHARILNLHAAPVGNAMKNRAVAQAVRTVTHLNRSTEKALLVVGGDFNLTRCQGLPRTPERKGCAVRLAHRQLGGLGFTDVVRSRRTADVVGVRHRIDFIYTQGRVVSSWWDRCYLAYNTTRPGCRGAAARFPVQRTFGACQIRADHHGTPGGRCSPRMYKRYYSDHPVVRATIAWT